MKRTHVIFRWIAVACLGLLLLWAAAAVGSSQALAPNPQQIAGESFGVFVSTAAVTLKEPAVTLPATGEDTQQLSRTVSVTDLVTAKEVLAFSKGDPLGNLVKAYSLATAQDVNILNGLVTAKLVVSRAASRSDGAAAVSKGSGFFSELVVSGTPLPDFVQPNTTIDILGVGSVILNEQTASGDGVTTSGIRVNMIHVVLKDALTGATTGDIIVGSAQSAAASP